MNNYNVPHIKNWCGNFMSFLPKSPQERILQGFNVVISREHIRNVNYDRSSEAVITDWRITASLGVISLYSSRNNVKKTISK